jgi:hypothetical protein
VDNGAAQTCDRSATFNSWYGHGQVNALTTARNASQDHD